jgi:hypothetical protein
MAGLRFSAGTEGTEVALTAATERTIIQVLAATNVRLLLHEFSISFDGVSATAEPVQVRLVKQTTAGSGSSAVTLRKHDSSKTETLQATAIKSPTSEPTLDYAIKTWEIHPQAGMVYPFRLPLDLAGATRYAITAKAPATLNCEAYMDCEE